MTITWTVFILLLAHKFNSTTRNLVFKTKYSETISNLVSMNSTTTSSDATTQANALRGYLE